QFAAQPAVLPPAPKFSSPVPREKFVARLSIPAQSRPDRQQAGPQQEDPVDRREPERARSSLRVAAYRLSRAVRSHPRVAARKAAHEIPACPSAGFRSSPSSRSRPQDRLPPYREEKTVAAEGETSLQRPPILCGSAIRGRTRNSLDTLSRRSSDRPS